ncbi:lysophospholipid acyltransferase family protein [Chrysiogenes arsenatis]|uniref:lysophospholipid acyltransferase family protein n=1 Tax=Chrysiogenes arsenatis TaxID=309797 RepID=UPI00041657BB|nr:lysophospholipid acyltransferase family protein [Chrysiogenes arsenatis]
MKRLTQVLVPLLLQAYLKICLLTCSKRYEGVEYLDALEQETHPFTLASWHGRLLGALFLYRRGNVFAVISNHRDGELIARVIEYFGHQSIRGSSSHGAASVLRLMIRKLREGADIAITPDGPRGPVHHVKPGAAAAARSTGTPILPISYGVSRGKRFASWDSFLLPYPFATLYFVVEPPLYPSETEDETQLCQALETALNRATQKADAHLR